MLQSVAKPTGNDLPSLSDLELGNRFLFGEIGSSNGRHFRALVRWLFTKSSIDVSLAFRNRLAFYEGLLSSEERQKCQRFIWER